MEIKLNYRAAHVYGLIQGLVYGGIVSAALFGGLHYLQAVILILLGLFGPKLLWAALTWFSPLRTNADDRKLTAVHEAGHAVVAWYHPDWTGVKEVKLTPKSLVTAGIMVSQESGRQLPSEAFLRAQICVALGGRAAEQELLGGFSAGSSSDLEKARETADRMVRLYGMGDQPVPRAFRAKQDSRTESQVQERVTGLVQQCWEQAVELVVQHREQVELVAQQLLDRNHLTASDLETYFGKRP